MKCQCPPEMLSLCVKHKWLEILNEFKKNEKHLILQKEFNKILNVFVHLVKEAIVKCDFNVELALNTLLNNPGVFYGGPE